MTVSALPTTSPLTCTSSAGTTTTATSSSDPAALTEVPPDAFAALLAGVATLPLPLLAVPVEVPAEPAPTVAGSGGVPSVAMPVLRPTALTRTPAAATPTRALPATPALPGGAGQGAVPSVVALPGEPAVLAAPTEAAPVVAAASSAFSALLAQKSDALAAGRHKPDGASPVKDVKDVKDADVPPRPEAGSLPPEQPPTALAAPVATVVPAAAPATPTPTALGVDAPSSTHHVRPALLEAAKHLKTEGGRTSLVIRLDPPELGAVLVRLTVRDGLVDVQLRTPDLAARSDLQAQQLDVQQVLREQGLDLSSFDVAHGDVLSRNPNEERPTPERGTPRRSRTADGGRSTAHVMDDVSRPQLAGTWL